MSAICRPPIDVSTGGNHPAQQIPLGPGYQVIHSATIHREAGIPTGAVGMITAAAQADQIIRNGEASLVLLAREFLRDPYWPLHAAQHLQQQITWPIQYLRAANTKPEPRQAVATPTV